MTVRIDIENPRLTFARVTVELDGVEHLLKSVSYGDSMDRGDIEGNAQMSLGVSDGMYKTDEGEVELYADDYAELQMAFGAEFYTRPFTIAVAYQVEGQSQLTNDELVGCRWTKRSASDQAGPDALTRKLSFKPIFIRWNGQDPLPQMPEGAQ